MNIIPPVSIPFSKSKTLTWLTGTIAFLSVGCWLWFGNPTFDNALLDNPLFIKTLGAAALIFFGAAGYFFIRNLIVKGPGLIIDDAGIEDFSTAASGIKIYWKDIEAIEVLTIKSQPLILLKVNNPQTCIYGQACRDIDGAIMHWHILPAMAIIRSEILITIWKL